MKMNKINEQIKEIGFHIQIPFTPDDMIQYIEIFEKETKLPSITRDQIMDVFAMTVAYIQTMVLCKTDEKVFLEIFEKPNHLIIEPRIDHINLN